MGGVAMSRVVSVCLLCVAAVTLYGCGDGVDCDAERETFNANGIKYLGCCTANCDTEDPDWDITCVCALDLQSFADNAQTLADSCCDGNPQGMTCEQYKSFMETGVAAFNLIKQGCGQAIESAQDAIKMAAGFVAKLVKQDDKVVV